MDKNNENKELSPELIAYNRIGFDNMRNDLETLFYDLEFFRMVEYNKGTSWT